MICDVIAMICDEIFFATVLRRFATTQLHDWDMPQFKFAYTLNIFPGEFVWEMERDKFLSSLDKHYFAQYKSAECKKSICKFCSFDKWKLSNLQFIYNHVPSQNRIYTKY